MCTAPFIHAEYWPLELQLPWFSYAIIARPIRCVVCVCSQLVTGVEHVVSVIQHVILDCRSSESSLVFFFSVSGFDAYYTAGKMGMIVVY